MLVACGSRASKQGEDDWGAHWQAANSFYAQADYLSAEREIRAAINLLRGKAVGVQKKRAQSLYMLGLIQLSNSQIEPAKENLLEAQVLAQASDSSLLEAQIHNAFGRLHSVAWNYDSALASYREAERIFSELGGQEEVLALVKVNMAVVYLHRKDYRYAELQFQQALAMFESMDAPNEAYIAHALDGLASVCEQTQRFEQGALLRQRNLDLLRRVYGPDHPELAGALDNLAQSLMAQQRYLEAEQHFQQALRIRESSLGGEHSEVAITLHNLGLNYMQQEKYAQAEPLLIRARQIILASLGRDSDDYYWATQTLRRLYHALGQSARADALLDDLR